MKHIAIIPNYSGITDMIKGGEISPNFLVKAENDQKVYFSNSNGYKLVVSGNTYNMYQVSNGPLGYELEVDVTAGADLSFLVLGPDNLPITTNLDYYCQVTSSNADCDTSVYAYQGIETGVSNYELYWNAMETFGQASYQIILFIATDSSVNNYVQVTGNYGMTDEESCSCAGGTWDPVNQECVMPTCAEQGLCGDDPYDCHECTCEESFPGDPASICDCEGGFYWGDECHDEPEPDPEGPCAGDPECECNDESGYNWWEDDTCHSCEEEWESLGYSSAEECACDKRGVDSGVCPEPDPCVVDPCNCAEPGSQEECECQGGTWDGENCNFDEGE